jgi:hypothetical protein
MCLPPLQLLAVLDLVDNSLDASIHAQQAGEQSNFIGRCHIYPDVYDELGLGVSSETTTGIVIVNNCTGPIRSLKHALEVYDSSKVASGAGQVGENGVGAYSVSRCCFIDDVYTPLYHLNQYTYCSHRVEASLCYNV